MTAIVPSARLSPGSVGSLLGKKLLLATSYFHVVFTLPHLLNTLIRQNPVELYNLLFRSVAETLMEVAANPKHLGAEIGFFAILHTWSQNLLLNPHS